MRRGGERQASCAGHLRRAARQGPILLVSHAVGRAPRRSAAHRCTRRGPWVDTLLLVALQQRCCPLTRSWVSSCEAATRGFSGMFSSIQRWWVWVEYSVWV